MVKTDVQRNTFVFLRYTFWNVTGPDDLFAPHILGREKMRRYERRLAKIKTAALDPRVILMKLMLIATALALLIRV